jgi:3-oxoacyl-[acyl-carrier-protein] synthase II
MLESLESAQRRATILAELVGYGASNDSTHITKPDADGQARAMGMALRHAGLDAAQIGYINAHGAGTAAGDLTETAIHPPGFRRRRRQADGQLHQSVHGHTLGAAGALEFV